MARFKVVDVSPRCLPVVLEMQFVLPAYSRGHGKRPRD